MSATISALFVLRLMQAAHFRVATALSLVGSGSPVPVIVGVFISLVPIVALTAVLLGVIWLVDRLRVVRRERNTTAVVARVTHLFILMAAASTFLPWVLLVFLALTGLLAWFVKPKVREDLAKTYFGMLAAIVIVSLLLQANVWLPAEDIELRGGHHIVAYVLREEADWTTLLTEKNRVILLVRSTDIQNRVICKLSSQDGTESLAELVRHESDPTPTCPG